MRYLVPALFAEGSSDDQFLEPLLQRALTEMCGESFVDIVEVGRTMTMRDHPGPASISEVVAKATVPSPGGGLDFDLLFFHRDGGSDVERTRREWIEPLVERWVEFGDPAPLISVVPVRETEAWLLADVATLQTVLGVRWSADEMGVPATAKHVERIPDPKAVLGQVVRRLPARAGGRRTRSPEDFYVSLGERVSVSTLRKVPAFASMWADALASLERIGYSRG